MTCANGHAELDCAGQAFRVGSDQFLLDGLVLLVNYVPHHVARVLVILPNLHLTRKSGDHTCRVSLAVPRFRRGFRRVFRRVRRTEFRVVPAARAAKR